MEWPGRCEDAKKDPGERAKDAPLTGQAEDAEVGRDRGMLVR